MERRLRRLERWNLALTSLLIAVVVIGAAQSPRDADFGTLTAKRIVCPSISADSPDGKLHLGILATNLAAGLWVNNSQLKPAAGSAGLYTQRPAPGQQFHTALVFFPDPTRSDAADLALSLMDGPTLQVRGTDDKIHQLDMRSLVNVLPTPPNKPIKKR